MLEHVWNNIILLNLRDFENIGINFYINIFLFFVALAIALYALFFEYYRGVMQLTVKQLLRHDAIDKDGARMLSELGLEKSRFVKLFLSSGSGRKKIVSRIGEPEVEYDKFVKMKKAEQKKLFHIDFPTERFYINKDRVDEARRVFSSYSFSVSRYLLFCLFIFLIWGAISAFSYEIISYLDSIIVTG